MPDAIGAWTIRDADPGARPGNDGWIAAAAPGDTYRALIAAGRLADPYVARHEADAAWVRDRAWWWRATIDLEAAAAGETIELVFDGLDTFADVYLDDRLLGRADNMFRQWRFDLGGIAAGQHELSLCFHPTATMVAGAALPIWSSFTDRISRSRRTLMRKAQFGWGWDWGPDLPTVGIWRAVRIERCRGAAVRSVNFTTLTIGDGRAFTVADVALTAAADVTVELFDPDGRLVASGDRHCSGAVPLTVENPRLWWTADLGEQPLYTLTTRVAGGTVITRRVGIRTLLLDQSPDPLEPGTTHFRFVLNGVPIFAKGANWVPGSSFVGAIPDETYRDLLERAVGANMNMIRVWGGGSYEPDLFFDECDQLGLLVWQDFMFACAPYPDDDPAFVDNVRVEVTEQVARLRHHACIALWCGNNENQAIHWFDDVAQGAETPLAGRLLYEDVIPGVLAGLDPHAPYWPGSPWGGPTPNSMRGGDAHNWTVWHGVPTVPDADPVGGFGSAPEHVAFQRYAEDQSRFVSEFGIQAAPDIATLRRWMAPDDLTPDSAGFRERIKDEADKASAMMAPVTGPPATLADYVDYTMLTQAEGLKFGIEHYRRRKPHCSGALIWQHNDCWPCVSWSLIDYDGVAKASWYAVARAFAPVLASFRRDGDTVELWLTNDTLMPIEDVATVALALFTGGCDWSIDVAVRVPANGSTCVWRGTVDDAPDRALIVRSSRATFPANRLLLAAVKDLALPDAGLTIAWDGDAVTVAATRYALAVQLRSDDPALRFSDNQFDLAAGERQIVHVVRNDGAPVAAETIAITSWADRRRNSQGA